MVEIGYISSSTQHCGDPSYDQKVLFCKLKYTSFVLVKIVRISYIAFKMNDLVRKSCTTRSSFYKAFNSLVDELQKGIPSAEFIKNQIHNVGAII